MIQTYIRGLALALTVALCACATPYQDMHLGLGVSATPLGNDLFRIQANLNQLNDPDDLSDYLLLRAAEAAQTNGAMGFVIVASQDRTFTRTFIIPGHATTTSTATPVGNSVYVTSNTTYTAPASIEEVHPGGGNSNQACSR